MGADGIFMAINNKVSQSVPHLHLHIVPRKKKDGLRASFGLAEVPERRSAHPNEAAIEAARKGAP